MRSAKGHEQREERVSVVLEGGLPAGYVPYGRDRFGRFEAKYPSAVLLPFLERALAKYRSELQGDNPKAKRFGITRLSREWFEKDPGRWSSPDAVEKAIERVLQGGRITERQLDRLCTCLGLHLTDVVGFEVYEQMLGDLGEEGFDEEW